MIKEWNKSTFLLLTTSLFLFSFLASLLVLYRVIYTGNLKNTFLIWNLFLAWIPFVTSLIAHYIYLIKSRSWFRSSILGILFFVWFFFYPNASYTITDFIHISQYNYYLSQNENFAFNSTFIIWYDFILIAIISILGLILGFLSIFIFQKMVRDKWNKGVSWIFVILATYITGIGIYIGRFIRWNSWDVILHPFQLGIDLVKILQVEAFIFAFLFGLFLIILHILLFLITNIEKEI